MPDAMLADVQEAIEATKASYDFYEWDTLPVRTRVASIYRMLKLMDAEAGGTAQDKFGLSLGSTEPSV